MSRDPARNRWLARARANPEARLRLFCFPFAGAGASVFHRWPDALPPTVDVCAVQLPGREDRLRETPHRDVDGLLTALVEGMGSHLTAPFALFGHSMGALVAFELARRLRREGRPTPALLIASGRSAPQLPLERPLLHHLPEAQFREELRKLDGTPKAVLDHDELMDLFSPLLRADFSLSDTYAYYDGPPLDIPLVALRGEDDPWVSLEALKAWRQQTAASFESREFPGNHFFLRSSEAQLLLYLGRLLSRWEGGQ